MCIIIQVKATALCGDKKMYSQNNEDQIIAAHFGDYKGTLVEIGANDGVTLSNSKLLIEMGWEAHLFEPSIPTFRKLEDLHITNTKVYTYPFGISEFSGERTFYESGQLLGGEDKSLVSCINPEEMKRWGTKVHFVQTKANFTTWNEFVKEYGYEEKTFDFISVDAEGEDWNILKQINMKQHNCKVLCVEWNSIDGLSEKFVEFANYFEMKEIHRNEENIIFAK
jgi:FkbM family methyltransferase